jgi:uncharacterized protein (TIGR03435 family)
MKPSSRIIAGFAFAAFAALCQTPPKPQFEVATVKPASTPNPMDLKAGRLRIGVNMDAQRAVINFTSLKDLIAIAYRVKRFQVEGPDWITSQRFDIQAKLPDGASSDQMPEMLQSLLEERFKLAVHRDSSEHPVYELVVGKNGPKLKDAAPDAIAYGVPDGVASGAEVKGVNKGALVVNGGAAKLEMRPNGLINYAFAKVTMPALVNFLSNFLDRPVLDKTGLKGAYEIEFQLSRDDMFAVARGVGMTPAPAEGRTIAGSGVSGSPADAASDPSSSSLFQSVQQLGLKLEARKAPLETIVVDHAEKTPTEN